MRVVARGALSRFGSPVLHDAAAAHPLARMERVEAGVGAPAPVGAASGYSAVTATLITASNRPSSSRFSVAASWLAPLSAIVAAA